MSASRHAYLLSLMLLMFLLGGTAEVSAQRFTVSSFRTLPNDVSAFINPVRDLNDEDCGLVKVMASEDFAFSAPLGIVKRVDKVGEIWLYMPRGSRMITIKHPEWGVLRDYKFPTRIDSHLTYELKIDEPLRGAVTADTVPVQVITTVTDTLVVTRVDTLVIQPVKKYIPLRIEALATVGAGGKSNAVQGGLMLIVLKRFGGFVHASTDFGSVGQTIGECGKNGETDGSTPFYSGRTRRSAFMVNAGVAQRLSDRVALFEGAGYSTETVAWELAPSEGGGYLKNTGYSTRGISFEAGAVLTFGRVAVSASVVTVRGTQWAGTAGVGIRLGR